VGNWFGAIKGCQFPANVMTDTTQSKRAATSALSPRAGFVALLPISFFLAHASYYWRHGGLSQMLWMCNLANLMLGVGLLLGFRELVRVAVFWLIPGLPIWFWFVVIVDRAWLLTSTFSHIGGLAVGLWAMRRVGASRITWAYATGWYFVVQAFCRLFTSPALNVNLAHKIYAGYESAFDSYWEYWAVTSALVASGMFALGLAMRTMFRGARTAV
jgi:hypothetical protein